MMSRPKGQVHSPTFSEKDIIMPPQYPQDSCGHILGVGIQSGDEDFMVREIGQAAAA
jgi:hypothetical protein